MENSNMENSPNHGTSRLSPRTLGLRALNLALWLSFCAMAGTGLLLAFRLPPGSQGGRGLQALGLGRHAWGDLHTWISYAFITLIVLHLGLHGRWLWQIASRRRAWPLGLGFGLGLALLFFLWFQPVTRRGDVHRSTPPPRHQKVNK